MQKGSWDCPLCCQSSASFWGWCRFSACTGSSVCSLRARATKAAVIGWCAWSLAAYAGKVLCFTLSTGISHHAAYNILEGLRLRLVERFLHAPLGEVQKHSIGEIKSILVDKIENIEPPTRRTKIKFSRALPP